ncbi:COBW domain-containing protein 1 [Smittium mucronatum]|uniref:COBW domain-containing protein 1 n=1 Tax=Smittium mucronatum TaxID=133383 RepID=A0A1R0GRE0_9FUNG|nr:COBW domain-containing protein 1 [Smittium mucronatum]
MDIDSEIPLLVEIEPKNGIDEAIVTNDPGRGIVEEWLDLDNGCIDKGLKALESLAEKRGNFDYILLETTGVADPGQIASMLWTNEELGSNIKLDGIVTLVDGHNILQELNMCSEISDNNGNTADILNNDVGAQIAYADRIIINKIDLISDEKFLLVSSELRIDLDSILNINAYSASEKSQFFSVPSNTPKTINHKNNVETCVLSPPFGTSIEWKKLESWIQSLMWSNTVPIPHSSKQLIPNENTFKDVIVLRIKGILNINDFTGLNNQYSLENSQVMIQGVREIYDAFPLDPSLPEKIKNVCKLVIIGKNLPDCITDSFFEFCVQ